MKLRYIIQSMQWFDTNFYLKHKLLSSERLTESYTVKYMTNIFTNSSMQPYNGLTPYINLLISISYHNKSNMNTFIKDFQNLIN
jgi:hypothetical protein